MSFERRTWNQAVDRWLREAGHKVTLGMDQAHLRAFQPYLVGKHLDEISRDSVDEVVSAFMAAGSSNATINRRLEVLRAILRRCVREWEWLDRYPHIRMLREPKRRIRFLTRTEARTLLHQMPVHLAAMAEFTLVTGLRRSNVTGLRWSQVDLSRRMAWIHADEAKARQAIPVPLNRDAVRILEAWQGEHHTHVFSYNGRPITQTSTKAWYAALRRAGIDNFRWHDLRHTWASWHAQQGTPLHVLQELGGWESVEMVRRYAHFSAEHLAPYADRLQGLGGQ